MNKKSLIMSSAAAIALTVMASAVPGESIITKDAGTTIVNTTTLTQDVKGFKSNTPVKIYIKDNRVVKVEPLQNRESPQYFSRAKALLTNFEGKTVTKAEKMGVDAVSGATLSSNALIKNVKTGLQYFKKHK